MHALVFPFPLVGHINPLLQIASSLCSGYGVKVTFLVTEYRLSQMEKESKKQQHELLSFYAIPDDFSAEEDRDGAAAFYKLLSFMDKMAGSGVFEAVMQDLQSRDPPVNCIISDTFVSWTRFEAEKLGIPRMAYWFSCASTYLTLRYTPLLIAQGLSLPLQESEDMVELPGICTLPADRLPDVMQASSGTSDAGLRNVLRLFENDQKCAKLIINSYMDLEPEQIKILKNDFRSVAAIGPLLPTDLLLGTSSSPGTHNRLCMSNESHDCRQWLDSKPPASVLYVSFGTIVSLGKEELHELALGLESSKSNCLWVMRGSSALDEGALPEGFLERVKEHFLIVSWAPQLEVLAHPSVGGFLTHCGWNSTIESLSLGVPLLGMPTDFADLKTIAWLIEHTWKVGVQLKMDTKGKVSQMEVAAAVRAIMDGEEGAVYRENAQKFRNGAKKAVVAGGSSHDAFRLLAQDVIRTAS